MLKYILVILSLTCAAFSRNLRYDNIAYGPRGPIPNALIAVCTQPANTNVQPCTPLAPLCSSTTDTTCTSPNPLQADGLGNYHFYVKSSTFTVQTYGPQVRRPFVQTDQGTFPATVGFFNGAYNALACTSLASPPSWCSGSDIGAWVNAAAASCNSSQQCYIIIPPSAQLTITTPIVFVNNETLECTKQNKIDNTNASNSGAQLYYNGSGTAVTMGVYGGRFVGCDLLLGSSVTAGVVMSGYSNHITDAGIRGGGNSTYLVHISGTATEDNHIEQSRLSYFTGIGIGCDHANDNFVTDVTAYGQTNNTTGITILEDASCTGTQLTNVVGGNSGANFFKARYTLSGTYPTYVFARNTQCDLAQSDCYVFASSLGTANMDYTFVNAWAAGAGGSGIHLSGGVGIRFLGGIIRENDKDGFTIDGTNASIFIDHNLIEGNNQSNAGYNGITISAHAGPTSVIGNIIQNAPEVGGNQGYAISTSADVEGLIFAENFCSNNLTGCANLSSVTSTKLTYYGNISLSSGVSSQPQYFLGWAQAQNFQANTGGTCASGNLSLGTGWGTSASAGTFSGYSQTCAFTITSGSGSFSSAPTFTFTFPSAFSATPVCTADVQAVTGSGGAIIFNNTTPSATAPIFTATTNTGAAFTPAASETYKIVVRCGP